MPGKARISAFLSQHRVVERILHLCFDRAIVDRRWSPLHQARYASVAKMIVPIKRDLFDRVAKRRKYYVYNYFI